jgi:hypothetical protein
MQTIDILVPANMVRRFHLVVAERLVEKGYDAALVGINLPSGSLVIDDILAFERKVQRLRGNVLFERLSDVPVSPLREHASLRLDLTGSGRAFAAPTLTPHVGRGVSMETAAHMLMQGRLPDIDIVLDGQQIVAQAAPMIDSRLSLLRGLNDVLARMVSLLVDAADRHLKSQRDTKALKASSSPTSPPTSGKLVTGYLFAMMPRQLMGAIRRTLFNIHHWHTLYRFRTDPSASGLALSEGGPWTVLPDDGCHFYADPFPFDWNGRHFIFVEDFARTDTKAVLSVAEVFADGTATVPRTVIDEPYHLSYPQVFSRDGDIWMLPEGAEGNDLVLYRAESFPDRWVRHAVLVPGRTLFDATLLEHDGRLWLFASERDGYGSASDMMVVYHADSLQGPWTPHRGNPVCIDRAAARPGGQFLRIGDRILLPLQNGTTGYGDGLGVAELLELNEERVRLSAPTPLAEPEQATPAIHTFNRSGRLEVIDCKVSVPRWRRRRRRDGDR